MVDIARLNKMPYPSRYAMKKLMGQSKFDVLPKHHPCSPWKYERRMDDLNEPLAEPAPVSDAVAFG